MRSSKPFAIAATSIIAARWSMLLLASLALASTGAAVDHPWTSEDRPSRAEVPMAKGVIFDVYKGSAVDPPGDTFASSQFDISGFSANVVGDNLVVTVSFFGPISEPDSGLPNAVQGFIDIDADQDGNTGEVPWVEVLSGIDSGLGDEYHVDLFDFVDGTVELVDDATADTVGMVPITFTSNSFTVEIPLALIGDDDEVNVAAAIVTSDFDLSDIVPNSGSVSSSDDTSVLLQGNRFLVAIDWSRPPNFPDVRPARVSDFVTDDSAVFFFNNPNNLEFLIKVLNGCNNTNHFWVFFAGATDVEFTVRVTDTQTNATKTYFNPLGNPADAVTDTQAFATCP